MNRLIFWIMFLLIVSAIAANFYTFYYKKDFDFTIETPCDESTHTCFVRDCSDGTCPPNNLSKYRSFHIKAIDYEKCQSDFCLAYCEINTSNCAEIKCGNASEDICSSI